MNNEVKATEHHGIRFTFLWIASIASVIIIGVVGYAVYLVRAYIVILGYVWLVSLAILPTLGLTFAGVCLVKFILKPDIIEIGPSGNLLRLFNRTTEYHPLGIKEHRVRVREEKEKFQVPALLDILKSGLLGAGDLLLGYHLEGDARWGSWDDLRTFAVAGKSRSGKTVTMVFFILQALLAGATVYICDPHYNKPTGLLKILQPIIPFLKVAKTDQEIIAATCEFREQMLARKSGKITELRPMLIVYDEWSELLRELGTDDIELLIKTVLGCAEAYAGFNGYAMVAGHEWTARESGGKKGAAIRRGFHACFVHRLDDEYAKFLLKNAAGKKAAVKAPSLPRGHAYFQDSEGELDYLLIPFYGKEKEAVYEVADMLKQLPSPQNYEKLSPGQKTTGPLSLPLELSGESVKAVKQLQAPRETSESVTLTGESFTVEIEDQADGMYTPEKEKAIILAAFELATSGQKVTRSGIRDRLGWTNKQWDIIKAVCDKHRIAS